MSITEQSRCRLPWFVGDGGRLYVSASRQAAWLAGAGLLIAAIGGWNANRAQCGEQRLGPAQSASLAPIVAISRPRARASRDITVPIGTSVASAISR
jgi:hypothetical protein